jgi:predicted CXXCH cytochrome family protein
LVRQNVHPPFEDESCDACHDVGESGQPVLVDDINAVCAACHDMVNEMGAMAHQHPPFADGECTGCHGLHAAEHEKLLLAEGERLCLSCHEDMVSRAETAFGHRPFEEGRCIDCHTPHASQYAGLTTKPQESLCLECHQDVQTAIADGEPHEPAAGGDCAVCHQPHGGSHPALLVSSTGELCAGCHDVASGEILTAHSGFSVSGADCTDCHSPHAGVKGTVGLLLPDGHQPFIDGECMTCHSDKSGQALTAAPRALCLSCHTDFEASIDKPVIHAPIHGERSCVDCHSPHVGYGPGFMGSEGVKACLDCHDDAEFTGTVRHEPAYDDCTTCHQPHAADHRALLETADIQQLCVDCHDDAAETHFHPMGEGVIDPRTKQDLVCTGCHSPHSSSFGSVLVADKNRKLCILCHDLSH